MGDAENFKWRFMNLTDLKSVKLLADAIHPSFPEDEEIFREKLQLYPVGCYALVHEQRLAGYSFAHPWLLGQAPALNSRLSQLPANPDTLYLHDLALAPHARGKKAAYTHIQTMVDHVLNSSLFSISLVAVSGSTPFWEKNGFIPANNAEGGIDTYGPDACYMVRYLDQWKP